MPHPYSITNPAPGHCPTVTRQKIGIAFTSRPVYGTRLHCECGWTPRRDWMDGRVSNSAPSSHEGKRAAKIRYLAHLQEAGVISGGC